jgi:hypothetical protein
LRVESQYWDGVIEFNMNKDLYNKELVENPLFLASLLASHINGELVRSARSLFTVTRDDICKDMSLPQDQRKYRITIRQEIPREEVVSKPSRENIVTTESTRPTRKTFVPEPGPRGELGYVVQVDEEIPPEGQKLS